MGGPTQPCDVRVLFHKTLHRIVLDTKDIIDLGKTEGSPGPIVRGMDVFEKDLSTRRLFRFSRKRYIFLNLLHDGLTLEEAAVKAGLPLADAEKFRGGAEAADYLEMRELREIVAREAKDPDRWWTMGFMAIEGKKPMNKIQCEIYKEHGKRIQPCSEVNQAPMKVEINISPEALSRSRDHRKFVETQIIEDLKRAM